MEFKELVELSRKAVGFMPMIKSRTDKKFPYCCKSIRVRILFVNSSFFHSSFFFFFLKFRTFQEIGLLINVCYIKSAGAECFA